MKDTSALDNLLKSTLDPDFKLEYLDRRVSPQEYLISNLTRIGRMCLLENNHSPSIVMLDDQEKIICNHQFKIKYTPKLISAIPGANVHIDIISDHNPELKLYYTVVHHTHATATPTGNFGYVKQGIPFVETPIDAYEQVVAYITSGEDIQQRYPNGCTTETLIHSVDFTTKIWEITAL